MGWFVNTGIGSKLENISSIYKRMEKLAVNHYNEIVDYYKTLD